MVDQSQTDLSMKDYIRRESEFQSQIKSRENKIVQVIQKRPNIYHLKIFENDPNPDAYIQRTMSAWLCGWGMGYLKLVNFTNK